MDKVSWNLFRRLDRRTRYLAEEAKKREYLEKDVTVLQSQVDSFVPHIEELKKILERRKLIKQFLLWVFSVVLVAALTAVVTNETNLVLGGDVARKDTIRREVANNGSTR